MLSFVMAVAIATSSETLDGIKLRGGSSCSNGSCGVAAAPVEKKVETSTKQEVVQNSCSSGGCGSRHRAFKLRCR